MSLERWPTESARTEPRWFVRSKRACGGGSRGDLTNVVRRGGRAVEGAALEKRCSLCENALRSINRCIENTMRFELSRSHYKIKNTPFVADLWHDFTNEVNFIDLEL